jgi:sulfite dehydrogenase
MGYISYIVTSGVVIVTTATAPALDIKLPPETVAFKQDVGAEIANGQCLTCHSVEYVVIQPPMQRAFWKAEVVKMQQKYGAQIPDGQVEAVVDYLTKNYGVTTNGAQTASIQTSAGTPQAHSAGAQQIATKYGCLGCHNPAVKLVGPAYRDIAAKYKTDPAASAKIDEQIHKGGSGKWGPIIMPPFPQVTASESKVLADWILGLK